jgi:type I restriction enzyme S subunit
MSFEIPFSHIAEIIMGQSPKGEEVNNEGIGLLIEWTYRVY